LLLLLLLLYSCFTAAFAAALQLLYSCFTAALLLLYCCFTAALPHREEARGVARVGHVGAHDALAAACSKAAVKQL
jgi:hypothetical protein